MSGFNLARFNPFLYRSYIYDYETGLYYLQSRYYDPETQRFINADEPTFIGTGNNFTFNAYAYCGDDPANMVDYWGTDAIWLQAKDSVAGLGHTGLIFKCKNEFIPLRYRHSMRQGGSWTSSLRYGD